MNCQEIRQYFSPWLDGGELSADEAGILREHLAECALCVAELEKMQAITAVLGRMRVTVTPPEGFTEQVMERLRGEITASGVVQLPVAAAADKAVSLHERKGWRGNKRAAAGQVLADWWRGVKINWKKSMAVAAAFVLLMGGSMAVAAKYFGGTPWLFSPPLMLVDSGSGQDSGKATGGEHVYETAPDARSEPGELNDDVSRTAPEEGANNIEPAPSAPDKTTGQSSGDGKDSTGSKAQVSTLAQVEPKVFLNQSRAIESLFLKVRVSDLDSSARQLVDKAQARGASYSVNQRVQVDGDRTVEIFRFEVPQPGAEQFVAYVNSLGQVINSQRETKDVSDEFATKLNRYQSLLTEKKTSSAGQAQKLDTEIQKLEAELTTLDKEARQQLVMIVWLEQ